MESIDELVEAAKKFLDESGKWIAGGILYIEISKNKILGQDFKKFQDVLNKTPEISHKVMFGPFNDIYTVYSTKAEDK